MSKDTKRVDCKKRQVSNLKKRDKTVQSNLIITFRLRLRTDISKQALKLYVRYPENAITKTCLFKYIENFTIKKENFQIKNSDIFHISAQIMDCGYSLEPPWRGGSNEYPQSMFLS